MHTYVVNILREIKIKLIKSKVTMPLLLIMFKVKTGIWFFATRFRNVSSLFTNHLKAPFSYNESQMIKNRREKEIFGNGR